MKRKDILSTMDSIDDTFIHEIFIENEKNSTILPEKPTLKRYFPMIAAACAACIIFCLQLKETDQKKPQKPKQEYTDTIKEEDNKNTIQIGTKEVTYYSVEQPEIIPCDYRGAEGGGSIGGWLTVDKDTDFSTCNPTLNKVNEIQELPVFKNDPSVCQVINTKTFTELEDAMQQYFTKPEYIQNTSNKYYAYDGIDYDEDWIYCQIDPNKNLTEQLLEYTFQNFQYYDYHLELSEKNNKKDTPHIPDVSFYKITQAPEEEGMIYPLISLEQAEKKLREGKFLTYGTSEKDVAESAEILSVVLEYRLDNYQKYIQPFYKFIITDKSWTMEGMNKKYRKNKLSISEIYIPAIKDEYIEYTENAKLYVN